MATLACPSSAMRPPSTPPCSRSGGALRKYRPLSGYVVSSSDQQMAKPPQQVMRRHGQGHAGGGGADDGVNVLGQQAVHRLVGGVRRGVTAVTGDALDGLAQDAASGVDLLDRSKPANSGGPRKASEPVCGRIEPITSVPSPARVPSTGTGGTSASAAALASMKVVAELSIRLSSPNVSTPKLACSGSPVPANSSGPDWPS